MVPRFSALLGTTPESSSPAYSRIEIQGPIAAEPPLSQAPAGSVELTDVAFLRLLHGSHGIGGGVDELPAISGDFDHVLTGLLGR